MKHILTICILIFTLCGVRVSYGQAAESPYTDADAYKVFSVILKDEINDEDGKAKKLVIRTETTDYPKFRGGEEDCLVPVKGEEQIYATAIAAYRKLNDKTWLLQPKLDASFRYLLVPKTSIDDIFGKKGVAGWKDFYAKYPNSGGTISLSAVGFNDDKTIAIVYMGHSCGSLCGGGFYHVLRKTAGKWSEVEWKGMTCTWAS